MTDGPGAPVPTADLLRDLAGLLDRLAPGHEEGAPVSAETLEALVARGQEALHAKEADAAPIRLLHHFACTGGTIFSKCIAAQPNALVLSEIDPLSTMHLSARRRAFFPSDILTDLHLDPHATPDDVKVDVFLAGLDQLRRSMRDLGRHLVVRDHAHSQFCAHPDPGARVSLRDMVRRIAPVRNALTVRHPLDSFVSLDINGSRGNPAIDLAEYAQCYQMFLDHHSEAPIFRYEDFVTDPKKIIAELCAALDMPFSPNFEHAIPLFSLSGDSGRASPNITARARRDVPEAFAAETGNPAYQALCARLGYDPAPP